MSELEPERVEEPVSFDELPAGPPRDEAYSYEATGCVAIASGISIVLIAGFVQIQTHASHSNLAILLFLGSSIAQIFLIVRATKALLEKRAPFAMRLAVILCALIALSYAALPYYYP